MAMPTDFDAVLQPYLDRLVRPPTSAEHGEFGGLDRVRGMEGQPSNPPNPLGTRADGSLTGRGPGVLSYLAPQATSPLRPGVPGVFRCRAKLLALPLDAFATTDASVEVRVTWLPQPLWFVPIEVDAEALIAEGISRGQIWTAGELRDLLAIPGITPAGARTIALAKIEFDGEVTEVRPTRPPSPSVWVPPEEVLVNTKPSQPVWDQPPRTPSPVSGRCWPPCPDCVLADRVRRRREGQARTRTPRRPKPLRPLASEEPDRDA